MAVAEEGTSAWTGAGEAIRTKPSSRRATWERGWTRNTASTALQSRHFRSDFALVKFSQRSMEGYRGCPAFVVPLRNISPLVDLNVATCTRSRPVVRTLVRETEGNKAGSNSKRRWRRRAFHAKKKEEFRKQKHIERRKEVQNDPQTKLVEVLDYFRGLGLSIEDCGRVVQRRPQLLGLNIKKDVEPMLRILHAAPYHMNEKQVARAVRNAPQMFFKNKKLFQPRLSFLREIGVQDSDLALVVSSRPHALWMDMNNAKRVVSWVKDDLGISGEKSSGKLFSSVPQVLLESPERLAKTVDWFREELGVEKELCAQIAEKWPLVFAYNPDTTLPKRIKFLREVGLQKPTIVRVVSTTPNIIAMSIPLQLQRQLDHLAALGIQQKQFDRIIHQVPTFFTTDVQSRIAFFLSIGLEKDDVAKIILKLPASLFYSVEGNLKPKWKYFTETMGGSVEDLKMMPTFFGLNLEERVMPRYTFCCARDIKVPMKKMVCGTDEHFCKHIAKVPYDEYRQFEQRGEWILYNMPVSL